MNIEEEIKKYEQEIKALNFTKGLNLNSKQTAQVVGVAQSTIEKWRTEGIGIEYISVGKRVMYPIRAIAKWQVLSQIRTA
ncbi:helix-turn-helix domain-containing protein [Aliarcobacter butzleri]|uniref:helix-turn-helix domain-containing protein n=1 Tax=Arcobacteraceae TaxID=2808963 RepID=UPI0021B24B10|nr:MULTISPECIES: helix-turn-helix domain-containing protein [Arcobacteraceae]MCT7564259.1 helix-turn-helix domain-containing protein [Aliarcobacter butzleri]MCT7613679.1 helix-turn-helix domain-containing protein [Aliarcobacter butzleri]MCT7642254.1 helix-turn-helix domain-containing protein [Aliarcobacter butzleri]MCT7912172.1 helix-turn-helix domain-containing protein [Arcobacter lacus]